MPQSRLTGSRIRERRLVSGIKQTDLAKAVGISPAYLNLIEHNKRRIGGKLLVDLARELAAEPASLSAGAEAALLGAMRNAASRLPDIAAELDRGEEFAGRFPGWAALIGAQHRRIRDLEHLVEALSDRLTHDPHLAASLHDVLSIVTAIRSAASILVETTDIDPDWQARFLRNVGEDSQRLSDSAQGLVDYLDAGSEVGISYAAPLEEVVAMFEASGYHFPALEGGETAAQPDTLLEAARLGGDAARVLAGIHLERYRRDAAALPLQRFRAALSDQPDPMALAGLFGVDLATVLRRIASLPDMPGGSAAGLVVCDGSGTFTFRKPIEGFPLPRFGAACPLWPLYLALAQPARPVSALVETIGRNAQRFRCLAIAQVTHPSGLSGPPVYEATMLIRPVDSDDRPAHPVGTSCRVCPRDTCPARREPSIMAGG